jgi:nitroreductase
MMDTAGTLDAIARRSAVRAYTGRAVEESVIRRLLEAAVRAPTALHEEPWGFAIIQDRARLKHYSDRAKALLLERSRPSRGAGGSHLAMLEDPAFNIFYDAGTLVVICRRIASPFAEADCWLAAENLMLAATAQGLGTCCIGFAIEALNAEEARRELRIPAEGAAVAPIIVGHPRAASVPTPREAPAILAWLR